MSKETTRNVFHTNLCAINSESSEAKCTCELTIEGKYSKSCVENARLRKENEELKDAQTALWEANKQANDIADACREAATLAKDQCRVHSQLVRERELELDHLRKENADKDAEIKRLKDRISNLTDKLKERDQDVRAFERAVINKVEDIDRMERELMFLANEMVYRGNSVSYIYDKAKCYGNQVMIAGNILSTHGLMKEFEQALKESEGKNED